MPDRHYLPETYSSIDRPVYLKDVGSLLKISGLVLQGMGTEIVLLLPTAERGMSKLLSSSAFTGRMGRDIKAI